MISEAVKVLLENIGEDVYRKGLLKTPERYAKALLYLVKGYDEDLESMRQRMLVCLFVLVYFALFFLMRW